MVFTCDRNYISHYESAMHCDFSIDLFDDALTCPRNEEDRNANISNVIGLFFHLEYDTSIILNSLASSAPSGHWFEGQIIISKCIETLGTFSRNSKP